MKLAGVGMPKGLVVYFFKSVVTTLSCVATTLVRVRMKMFFRTTNSQIFILNLGTLASHQGFVRTNLNDVGTLAKGMVRSLKGIATIFRGF
jgi:hypothetical protein